VNLAAFLLWVNEGEKRMKTMSIKPMNFFISNLLKTNCEDIIIAEYRKKKKTVFLAFRRIKNGQVQLQLKEDAAYKFLYLVQIDYT
jgi:hypothetical protein